jgi:hypothetical protein
MPEPPVINQPAGIPNNKEVLKELEQIQRKLRPVHHGEGGLKVIPVAPIQHSIQQPPAFAGVGWGAEHSQVERK